MKTSDILSNLLTVVLVICALVITGLVVRRELGSPAAESQTIEQRGEERDWKRYATGYRRAGPPDAAVAIIEFSDFQCPYCRVMAARLDSVRALYPDVSLEYRHFPLRTHPHAIMAARASDCALAQGKFWEMHDALFENQDSIGVTSWARYAAAAGLADSAAFERCLGDSGKLAALHDDTVAAKRLGVVATPTILINQHRLVGALPLDTLREYISRARESRD